MVSHYEGELSSYGMDPVLQDIAHLREAGLSPDEAADHMGDGDGLQGDPIPCAQGEDASISASAHMGHHPEGWELNPAVST